MFQYCPSCGTKKISLTGNRFLCGHCGFIYYHNTAAASGCIIMTGDKIALLVRGQEPALGKLDLPGGFVDPGEGILEGLVRELKEELGWEAPWPKSHLADYFTLFASFPNVYPYKGINYNTCDVYFTISVPNLSENDIRIQAGEIAGLRLIPPDEIDLTELAFDSTRRAMAAYIEYLKE